MISSEYALQTGHWRSPNSNSLTLALGSPRTSRSGESRRAAVDQADVFETAAAAAAWFWLTTISDRHRDDRQEDSGAAELQQPLAASLHLRLAFLTQPLLAAFLSILPSAHAGLPT